MQATPIPLLDLHRPLPRQARPWRPNPEPLTATIRVPSAQASGWDTLASGMAPLDGPADIDDLPLLDSVLPIPGSELAALESRRYAARIGAEPEAIDIDIDRVQAMLAGHGSVQTHAFASHVDTVRAQLESVVLGVPPPGPVAAVPTQPAEPVIERPTEPACAVGTAPGIESPGPVPAAGLIELTLQLEATRARADELQDRVARLEAELAAERGTVDALSRRFGRQAHESFGQFVARLGMTARAVPLSRTRTATPGTDRLAR